jgi:hypothetical protein
MLAVLVFGLVAVVPTAAQSSATLAYGTFLGGASDDIATAVAYDAQGNIYIAGYTYSAPFPGTNGQRSDTNAFVTKLNPSGTALIYSTLIGGSDDEQALALAVDAQGNAWVAGFTESDDLPLTNPISTIAYGDTDTFVARLSPSGAPLLQTYLAEDGDDRANAIALDPQGNAYLAGYASADFGPEVMVRKIKADGKSVVYSAFFGSAPRGFARGSSAHAIAVDADGNAYIAGKTNTGAFDTGGLQDRCAGWVDMIDDCPSDDGFVVILNAAGNSLTGGTILGGLQNDSATSVALDANRNIYVAGTTFSDDFPTQNAWQAQRRGFTSFADGFLVKLSAQATSLEYGTYYGGDAFEEINSIAVDSAGRAYLTGLTSSNNLPVPGAFQPAITGICYTASTERYCYDAFVASFDASGTLSWGSYIGGADDDLGHGIAIGGNGAIALVGRAGSFTLPTTANALQPQRRGADDAFLVQVKTGGATIPSNLNRKIYTPFLGR